MSQAVTSAHGKSSGGSYGPSDCKVCLPQIFPIDHLATTSLQQFIQRFGSKVMLLYDSVLAGKRILFSGDTASNSVEEVQDCVYACASLAQPLMHGIGNLLNGYIDFNSVDLLDESCYIAGVINPIFK